MINHDLKLIFIHIPKCAGTSIEKALGHHDLYTGRDRQDHRTLRAFAPKTLGFGSSIDDVKEGIKSRMHVFRRHKNPKNALTVTPTQYKQYFKAAIVRDPWDRAFSVFRNIVRDPQHRRKWGIKETIPFDEFLNNFVGKRMLRPQLHWIVDYSGNIGVDYVGRFESLSSSFATICSKIGVDLNLGHELFSSPSPSRQYYNPETRKLVELTYRDEIRAFDYSF